MSESDSSSEGRYAPFGRYNPYRTYQVAPAEIAIIHRSLKQTGNAADIKAVNRLLLEIIAQRHASRYQIEDLFYAACRPLSEIDRELSAERWCEILSIPTRNYGRASEQDGAVSLTLSVEPADLAELLIILEGLGYAIDPLPLVRLLVPWISRQDYVNKAEIGVLWYQRERHRGYPIELRTGANEGAEGHERRLTAFETATGYTVDLEKNSLDRPVALTVTAPLFLAD